MQAKCC